MARSRLLTVWLPVVAWAAVIFTLSSIPSLSTGLGAWDTILRKGAHLTEYAIFGFLLMRALGRELPSLLLGVAYAVTDEIHQHFVRGRHASPFDVAFDAAGVALGLLIAHSVQSRRARTEELRRPAAGRDPRAPRRAPDRAADAEPPA